MASWKALLQRIHPLLISFKLGGGVIEGLLREHALCREVAGAVQSNLVVGQRGSGLIEIVLRLLNFLGTRSVLQLFKISPGVIGGALGLLVLGAEFVVFEAHQDLAFFDLVALFHADPLHPARHFGIQVDLVMSHDVAAGGEHHAADLAALRRGAHHFHFRSVVREQTVRQCAMTPSSTSTAIPIENVAARPDRRLAFAAAARPAIDSQALQVFVFCVNRHMFRVAPALSMLHANSVLRMAGS